MTSIAYFKHAENDEKLSITFKYTNNELKVDKTFNFCREITEKPENLISRIKSNLEKEVNKKQKKRKKNDAEISETPQLTEVRK
jgi:hypothetical protein